MAGPNCCTCKSDGDCAGSGDGDLCKGSMVCQSKGSCTSCVLDPQTAVTCDASGDTACAKAACEPKSGKCVAQAVADGAGCDDGDACTEADACSSGKCGGKAKSCDDGNGCTVDSCDAKLGCSNLPAASGTSCKTGLGSDGTCDAGACKAAKATCDLFAKPISGDPWDSVLLRDGVSGDLLLTDAACQGTAAPVAIKRFGSDGKLKGQGSFAADAATYTCVRDVVPVQGGLIVAGAFGPDIQNTTPFLARLDASDKQAWLAGQKGTGRRTARGLLVRPNGTMVSADGSVWNPGKPPVVDWSERVYDGNAKVVASFASPQVIGLTELAATSDGWLAVGSAGDTLPMQAQGLYAYAFRRKEVDGSIVWAKSIPNTQGGARSAAAAPDGGVVLVGIVYTSYAAHVVKIDASGNVVWHIGKLENQSYLAHVSVAPNGITHAFGSCVVLGTKSRWCVRRFDPLGNELLSWTFDPPRTGRVTSMVHDGVTTWLAAVDSSKALGSAGELQKVDAFGHSECAKSGDCFAEAAMCSDNNPCTLDSCSTAGGCASTPLADGTACNAGASNGSCSNGKCI